MMMIPIRIRFTLRTYDGRVIATAEISPIKITDDHKTDGKVKPRVEGMTSSQPQPAVPRARKGRQSAASSRRQSPAPSEGESVPSMSEAGAVSQKQTPHVRAGKPYERPALQSPIHGSLPTEGFSGALPFDYSRYGRQHSASSIHTTASMSALPNQSEMANAMPRAGSAEFPVFDQPQGRGTVSPGALRHPRFNGFIAMDGTTSFPSSAAHSAASSNAASPISQFIPLGEDDLLMNGHQLSPTELMQALQFATLPTMAQLDQSQMISGFPSNHIDIDMANAVGDSFDHIFDTSSHASLASSYNDNVSAFSGGFPEGSLFSESGLVPESDDMSNFLDFSSGQDQTLSRPSFSADSLVAESGQQQSIDQPSSFVESHFGSPNANSIPRQSPAERNPQVSDMLVSLSPTPYGPPPAQIMPPPSNAPTITTVIPAEGPVAGGTTVAIIGDHFSPDLVILFGGRTAKLERVSPTFIQCLSPPAHAACVVQVTIQGVWRLPESPPSYFKYNMMDTDL